MIGVLEIIEDNQWDVNVGIRKGGWWVTCYSYCFHAGK